jgi:hypothetical protein
LTVFTFGTLTRVLRILTRDKLEGGVAECAFTSVVFTFHAESTAVNTLVIDTIVRLAERAFLDWLAFCGISTSCSCEEHSSDWTSVTYAFTTDVNESWEAGLGVASVV